MSVETVPMYRVVCDWPGCEVSAQDESDFFAWKEVSSAFEEADNGGWHRDAADSDVIYCDCHAAVWSSDHEDGKPHPEPPFLLIHDGDDSGYEDGSVTLIEATA